MESMTTAAGFTAAVCSRMASREISTKTRRFSESAPIRFPRSLICLADSSPETYRTFRPVAASLWKS
jgi:hypothetical protein